jgi:hypothetical protein
LRFLGLCFTWNSPKRGNLRDFAHKFGLFYRNYGILKRKTPRKAVKRCCCT